jgi:hypothetical protein
VIDTGNRNQKQHVFIRFRLLRKLGFHFESFHIKRFLNGKMHVDFQTVCQR